jgi:hypothetical protein
VLFWIGCAGWPAIFTVQAQAYFTRPRLLSFAPDYIRALAQFFADAPQIWIAIGTVLTSRSSAPSGGGASII